jgi:Asp-tRNA(Asn)/Glu-tRNA(Gln) amidotransferase C subunit
MASDNFDVVTYVEQMALLLNLQLTDAEREQVIENFEKILAIAQLVNQFPLPPETEAAPIFQP